MSEGLDEHDRVKLETWYYVMNLLEHYRGLAFDPWYQLNFDPRHHPRLNFLSAEYFKEMRANKIGIIQKNHNELIKRWEKALGPNWRDSLEQD